jgi:hypothetical protein
MREDFNFVTMEERELTYDIGDLVMGNIHTHKGIYNPQTEKIIAVVGKGYQYVPNDVVFTQLEDAIYDSNLDTEGMIRTIDDSHGGARTVLTYDFPMHKMFIKDGDQVDLRITALNSCDTSWKFKIWAGAFRLLCTNGMTMGTPMHEMAGKHTLNLDTERAIGSLDGALQSFLDETEMWKTYEKITVSPVQVAQVFVALANGSKTLLKDLDVTFLDYVDELGHNLWALFNTLTAWSTHYQIKNSENAPSIIVNRDAKVRKLLPMLEEIREAA